MTHTNYRRFSMSYYPDSSSCTIFDRLDVVVRAMDAAAALHTSLLYPMLLPDTHGYDTSGKKYIRVWTQTWGMPSYCPACKALVKEALDAGRWDTSLSCEHPKDKEPGQRFVAFF